LNINHLIETGVRDYLRAEYPEGLPRVSRGVSDRGGFFATVDEGDTRFKERALPMTLIRTGEAETFIPGSGNYRVELSLSFISTSHDNSLAYHEQWAKDLCDAMGAFGWVDYLSDQGLVHVYKPIESRGASVDVESDDKWITSIAFGFACIAIC
jgi:hypothetical protein